MSDDADAALPARARRALNNNLYVAAQKSEEVHKPLGGKSGEPALQQARNLWLVNLQNAGGSCLGKTAGANRFGDTNCEVGFCEALLWLRQADVGEDISAAFFYVDVSMHCLFSFLIFKPSRVLFSGLLKARLNQIDLRFWGLDSGL